MFKSFQYHATHIDVITGITERVVGLFKHTYICETLKRGREGGSRFISKYIFQVERDITYHHHLRGSAVSITGITVVAGCDDDTNSCSMSLKFLLR